MNKIITFLGCFLCNIALFAQTKPHVYYKVNPLTVGANQITVDFDVLFPEIETEEDNSKIAGLIDFSLQIIDKKYADNPEEKGEEIAFFIESFRLDDPQNKTAVLTLPENATLQNNLPNDKIYRLIHKYDSLLLLNPENADFEARVPVYAKNNIITFRNTNIKNNLKVTYINFPEVVNKNSNFIIETKITNTDIKDCILPNVKIEVHIVDKKNLYAKNNLPSDKLVCESEGNTTVQAGTTNYYFKIKAPETPSAFLPEGKVYRLRLTNDALSNCRVQHAPLELVVQENEEAKISNNTNSEVTVFPNPANDFLIIKTKKKSTSYKIYDISGELIKEQAILRKISITDLKPGIYLLETDFGVTRFTKK